MTVTGRILTCTGGLYSVEANNRVYECYAKGGFRHQGVSPVPGDICEIRLESEGQRENAYLTGLHPRRNCLLRPPVANLDHIIIVSSVCNPQPNPVYIDKVCSIAIHNNISPILIFTKLDLAPEMGEEFLKTYKNTRIPVVCVSVNDPEDIKKKIHPFILGKTCAFAGASGVGKSTLINTLFPNLNLTTGQISTKILRGKNTTRQSVFFNVSQQVGAENTYLADTPGFSQLDLSKVFFMEKEDLAYTYPEFQSYLGTCKYTKCSNQTEDGCQILQAGKNNEISQQRLETYRALYQEIAKYKKWK